MRPPIAALLPVLALLLIAVACDDGDGQPKATTSPAGTGTPQATTTETAQVTPSETAQVTPTETAQGDATPSPSTNEPQPAVMASDQGGFLDEFQDVVIMAETCAYDPDNLLLDCGANGLYQLDEGIQDADAICRVLLVDEQPVGLSCQEELLAAPVYYEIQP